MPNAGTPFYYGWVIVAFTALMQVISIGALFYGIGVAYLPWMHTFNTGRTSVAAVPFACSLAISVLSPFAGPLIDRFPPRRIMGWSLAALALGLLGVSMAQSVVQLIVLHATLIAAGAIGGGALAAQTVTAKWFSRRRGLALSLTASGASVGGIIMPYVMAVAIEGYGWRATYAGLATFVLIVLVPLAVLCVRAAPAVLDAIESEDRAADTPAQAPAKLGTLAILRHPVFLVTSLGMGSLVTVQIILQFYLPTMGSALGSSPAKAALLVSILAGAALCSKPFWGYLIDRTDPRVSYGILAAIYTYMLILLAGWLGAVTYTSLAIGAGMCGFASGAMQALMGTVLARAFGRANFGRVLGLGHPVMNVSSFGPLFAAAMYERTGSYTATSAVLLVLLVVMLVLFMTVVSPRRGQVTTPSAG